MPQLGFIGKEASELHDTTLRNATKQDVIDVRIMNYRPDDGHGKLVGHRANAVSWSQLRVSADCAQSAENGDDQFTSYAEDIDHMERIEEERAVGDVQD